MDAPELLRAHLAEIQDPAAVAALFAEDGVIELPTINARAQGPAAIEKFIGGLLAKVPDFRFKNARIWIETPEQAFASTRSRRSSLQRGRSTSRPTPDASSPRTGRSSCCGRRSTRSRRRAPSARTDPMKGSSGVNGRYTFRSNS